MSPFIRQGSAETLRLGVENFVAYCLGEEVHDPLRPTEELTAMVDALADTAEHVHASEGMLVGMLREAWDAETGGPAGRGDAEEDVYVATVRLLYARLARQGSPWSVPCSARP